MKRYTAALLNNWVFDIRSNTKLLLIISNPERRNNENVSSLTEFRFFYTERTQYAIDYGYEYSSNKNKDSFIVYFFNVRRGNVFKNYVLTCVK
jgi:hypothetical protein